MEPQVSISDLPLSIWSIIFSMLIYNGYSYVLNITTLKQLYRCKIASKKLNQLLDDEYWLVTVRNFKSKYSRRYFMRKRLESIVKINDAAKLDEFRALAIKHKQGLGFYDRLASLFPLAIQHADLSLLRAFNRIPVTRYPNNKVLCQSIQKAYQQQDVEKIAFVLSFFRKNSAPAIAFIIEALKSGKKLDFSGPHKMIELLLIPFHESTRTEKINRLFGERNARQQAIIVPEGEFPNLGKLSHNMAFLRGDTNFTIQPKKGNSDLMALLFREKNGTMHEIDITKKIDQSDDSKMITYCYEGIETTNINSLLLLTSLAERMFPSYPQQFIAVTKELAALPYEQQPWFKGILTEPARQILASDAPNSTTFFTYSSENQIWLSFATTSTSRKQPNKIKIRDGKGLLDYLPKDKFWLGLHKGGEIFGLVEHLVRRAVHNGDFNLVKQLIEENNLDLKTNAYFDYPDNMLLSYLKLQKKESVDNDMTKWLIERETPLEKRYYMLNELIIRICNDDVIKMIAEQNHFLDINSMQKLMQRGCRYDTLTACWNTYLNSNQSGSLDDFFFEALEQNKFKKTTYKIRTLIMMAWKYDEHCLLRQLPKEIVLEILSYDYIDEPPYWDALHMLIESPKFTDRFFNSARVEDFVTVFPLVWKNWDLESYQPVKMNICKVMLNSYTYYANPSKVEASLPLFLKFLQRLPAPGKKFEINRITKLTKYCLLYESPITLELFKELLEKNITHRETLQSIDRINWQYDIDSVYRPPIFLPFVTENKPMIELLVDQGLFVDRVTDQLRTEHTLEKFLFLHYPSKLHLLKFVEEYRAKRHIDKN